MAEPTALRTLTNKPGVVEDLAKTSIFFASDWAGIKNWFAWVIELIGGKQASLGFTAENSANKKTDLTDNSDTYYPSQKAVKTAVDAKQDAAVTGSKATTFTFNGTGTPGTSGSVTVQMQKIGNWVTIFFPGVVATTGTGSYKLASNTAIDAAFRPTAQQDCLLPTMENNGAVIGTPGYMEINTDGTFSIYKDSVANAFTNDAVAGLPHQTSFTYYVG